MLWPSTSGLMPMDMYDLRARYVGNFFKFFFRSLVAISVESARFLLLDRHVSNPWSVSPYLVALF